jgi:transposase-like protein
MPNEGDVHVISKVDSFVDVERVQGLSGWSRTLKSYTDPVFAEDSYLNNRAENSHQPTRQRERRLQGFKSPGHAQRFLSAYGPITQHFRPRRHRLPASEYRQELGNRFHTWQDITGLSTAA